ncbi:MAG TPA: hypothetical protein VMV90_16365 [Rectinemataceae bacterium]|nr:hypothetical protein [Rectinemataceae bacterium]
MRVVAVVVAIVLAAFGVSSCDRMQALVAASGTTPMAALQVAPGRAILVSGPLAFRGLPFFSPNALSGLVGEYALAPPAVGAQGPAAAGSGGGVPVLRTLTARVWFTHEPLYFGARWTRGALGRYTVYSSTDQVTSSVILAFTSDRYELLVELPSGTTAFHRFAMALADRFALFFSESATDADISFPAFVDYAP